MPTKKSPTSLKILISGATGYVGYFLYDYFSKMGMDVYGISSSVSDIRLKMNRVDISDHNAVRKAFDSIQPDIVIHCAALADIDYCERNQEIAYNVNVNGTQNLIEGAKKYNIPFILLSTEAVYDGKVDIIYSEDNVSQPVNVYGRTKLQAEVLTQQSGLTYLIARCARVVGSSHKNTHRQFDKILDAARDGDTLQIDAERKFTPTWNRHLAEVIEWWITDYHKNLTCNVAALDDTVFYKLIRECAEKVERKMDVVKKPMAKYDAPRPKYTRLDSSLLSSLGAPMYSLEAIRDALINDFDALVS